MEVFDFQARQYDPQLGRFNNVEPLAYLREWIAPCNFCQNNPINRVDPTGAIDDVFITAAESKEVFNQLQSARSLKLE